MHASLETDLATSASSNIFSSPFLASDPLIIEVCGLILYFLVSPVRSFFHLLRPSKNARNIVFSFLLASFKVVAANTSVGISWNAFTFYTRKRGFQ